ncbi:hypothetical protein PG993_014054 [Apiospora rasikravindrae]|uniref:Uncharacterized protein n=1 Tax=Apiospora rasikravindrae TaxID=990691 RepID=A0ABR1RRZ4_9PEZI
MGDRASGGESGPEPTSSSERLGESGIEGEIRLSAISSVDPETGSGRCVHDADSICCPLIVVVIHNDKHQQGALVGSSRGLGTRMVADLDLDVSADSGRCTRETERCTRYRPSRQQVLPRSFFSTQSRIPPGATKTCNHNIATSPPVENNGCGLLFWDRLPLPTTRLGCLRRVDICGFLECSR